MHRGIPALQGDLDHGLRFPNDSFDFAVSARHCNKSAATTDVQEMLRVAKQASVVVRTSPTGKSG